MALKGDERRLISSANMHLPGRQVDPRQVQRDLWRLGRWERERLERHRARTAAPHAAGADMSAGRTVRSTSSTARAPSPRAATAPPRAPT